MKKSLLFLGSLQKGVFVGIVLAIISTQFLSAQTRTLRIVTYNIEADIGVTNVQPTFTNIVKSSAEGPPLPGLIAPPTNPTNVQAGGVLEGIGEEIVSNDPAQPIDILALEETTSNPQTVAPIVNGLNSFYGIAGMYSNSGYQATEEFGDPTGGDGPNAMVFNTKTVQLLASVPIDPPGGTNNLGSTYGEYREVMRYEFAPAGVAPASSNEFFIYVSHYKSGGSSDNSDRAGEAQIIVSDAAPNGIQQGAGVDPFNPTNNQNINWHSSSAGTNLLAQESDNCEFIQYRDDLEMMTTNVYSGASGGLKYVPGTYHTFGNNGTVKYQGTVNTNANTSLNNLATNGPVFIAAAQLLVDLTGGSDHLPVVADYTIPLPAPVITSFSLAGTNLVLNVANCITGGVYTVWMATNLALPLVNWTALATNVPNGGNFTFTATNAVNRNTPQSFYLLQTK